MTREKELNLSVSHDVAVTRAQWRIMGLLVLSICLNYMARTAFAVAAPVISKELGLRPDQIGLLMSAFFWSYVVFLVFSGWLVDRYPVKWVLGMGFLLWTVVTGVTGVAGALSTFFTLRLLLGVSESCAYPSYGKTIASTFPETRRGLCNSLIEAGNQIGPAIATLMGGIIVAALGWRALFFLIAAISALWLPAWVRWAPQTARRTQKGPRERPSFKDILRLRSAWGTFFGLFAVNYVWIFLVSWLPSYLVMERHFSLRMMAVFGSIPLWGMAISTTSFGWLSDHWITRGGTPTLVRKTFSASGLLTCTLFLPAVLVKDPMIAIGLLTVVCLLFGMTNSCVWAITQTIAGPRVTGTWTGMENAFGNLAGIVAPWLTGVIVFKTGSFYLAFLTVCIVAIAGAASFLFLVGRVEPFRWPEKVPTAEQVAMG